MNRKSLILIGFFALIIIVGSYFGSQLLFKINKIELNISTTPQDAKIIINGKDIDNKNIFLEPGKYMISVVKDDYYEYRKIYEVDEKNYKLSVTLDKKPEKTINELVYSSEYDMAVREQPIIKNLLLI